MNEPIKVPIPKQTVPGLIRPKRCSNCKHSRLLPKQNVMQCRRFPPTVAFFPQQHPQTGQITMMNHCDWPLTKADLDCGEHQPRVEDLN